MILPFPLFSGIAGKNDIVVTIDTSKSQLDTPTDIKEIANFLKAFLKSYQFDDKQTRISLIQKNGAEIQELLKIKDGVDPAALDQILTSSTFKIAGTGGSRTPETLLRKAHQVFARTPDDDSITKNLIIFTKDGKNTDKAVKNIDFASQDINVLPVVIGNKDDVDGDVVIVVDDTKNLPSVYPDLEDLAKELQG